MLQRIFGAILRFLRRIWGDQPVGWATLLPGLLLTAVLLALPTGYEGAVIYQGTQKVRATVLATNEDTVISTAGCELPKASGACAQSTISAPSSAPRR